MAFSGILLLTTGLNSLKCADFQKGRGGASADPSSAKGPMGPVFSTFVHEEESDNEL